METVTHHRHKFVLYSLRNIEPVKVDMHNLGQSTIKLIRATEKTRCSIQKTLYSLSVVAFGAPASNQQYVTVINAGRDEGVHDGLQPTPCPMTSEHVEVAATHKSG